VIVARLRIVFLLASADLAGGVRTVATYARLLGQRGHRVTVVSTPPRAPALKKKVKSLLLGRGWPRAPRPGPSHVDHPEIEHGRLERFRPICDRDVPDADVVIATWWLTAEWAAALSPRKGAKVHFVQGDDIETPGQPRDRVLATWRFPLRRIVCSRWLETLARERYGDPSASYVPNGIDLQQFSAPPRGKQPRPTAGLVYTDLEMKGCDVALSALAAAAPRLPGLRLVAFGSEPPSARLPLPPWAEYLPCPEQRRIPEIYASCDVWLWPSRREGFGLPVLEAMACRTPVVAAPAGAAPELLADGGGILLPAAEAASMARAIEEICNLSGSQWRALSDQARAAAEQHGWDRSVRLFEAALEAARDAAR
jgi:glycosyltransferase involved in cell wall biosynthesis